MSKVAKEVLILMDEDLYKNVRKVAFSNDMTISDFIGISCCVMLNDIASLKKIKNSLDIL